MKRFFGAAAALTLLIIGLSTAEAYSGSQNHISLTAGNGAGTLQPTEVSSAKKKRQKSVQGAGRIGASKAGTGGGAGGESGSGSDVSQDCRTGCRDIVGSYARYGRYTWAHIQGIRLMVRMP